MIKPRFMMRSLLTLVLGIALSVSLFVGPAQAIASLSTLPSLGAFQMLGSAPVPAGDIKKFVAAYQSIQTIRDDAEEKMATAIAAEGLTIDEFNTLAEQTLDGKPPSSDEEATQKFEAAIERIAILREEAEGTMATAIEKAGISVDRFNEILEQSDQDRELYERIGNQING
ncbi:MAG: hypothetical protein RLZZ597_2272 [Cyanobacteriota bacterium]|jgi:hypothetical protein